jgi:hypothetical protein
MSNLHDAARHSPRSARHSAVCTQAPHERRGHDGGAGLGDPIRFALGTSAVASECSLAPSLRFQTVFWLQGGSVNAALSRPIHRNPA